LYHLRIKKTSVKAVCKKNRKCYHNFKHIWKSEVQILHLRPVIYSQGIPYMKNKGVRTNKKSGWIGGNGYVGSLFWERSR